MADRRNYFKRQIVTHDELNAGFQGLEDAERDIVVDHGLVGLTAGGAVTQHSPVADLTVDVAALTAYDPLGRRIRIPTLQVVNAAVDSNNVATTVTTPGNSKIVSVFAKFRRFEDVEREDGDGNTVFFVQDESFEFLVVQGSEAVSPTPPALVSDAVLLVDITRTQGQTQIVTGNLSTARTQYAFVATAGSLSIRTGTAEQAVQAGLTELNNHVSGAGNVHPSTAISAPLKSSSPTSLAAGSVESQLTGLLAAVNARARLAAAEAISGLYTFSAGIIVNTVGAIFNALATFNSGLVVNNGQNASYQSALSSHLPVPLVYHGLTQMNPTEWGYDANGTPYQVSVSTNEIVFDIPVTPASGIVTTIEVFITGAGGHAALPGTMPRITYVRRDQSGVATLDQATDSSANTAAYQANHKIEITGLSRAVSGFAQQIRVRGESGSNSLPDMQVTAIFYTFTSGLVVAVWGKT